MSALFKAIEEKVKGTNKSIVFPEGTDNRILKAAEKLSKDGMVLPILLGNQEKMEQLAAKEGIDLSLCKMIDPAKYENTSKMINEFVVRRKGKATEEQAKEILLDENYFGTMLVYMGEADGLVSGAAHSTAETVRPALQIIKTKQGVRKTSGVFIMVRDHEKYLFGDCAINIAPDSQDLAEVAVESSGTARLFGIDPRVALLSFSTKGSAKSAETEKVEEALRIAKEKDAQLVVDGEFQFDAAFVPEVAKKKAPDSIIQGDANVFVFPSLEAGNIGYKIAQRLGGFEAVGPILQGLNQPVNDLSRGCSVDDVYKLALITAMQAEEQ
ncbi:MULTISPECIES: phosphate acetyltransferase [unclassified Virgibacillus]|uniref:phosphate acetyltransferase n=1 Tax=unclassified Virgibacillus TaxID=2620237 RepID=UPI0024DED8C6|nr:phosphate acetyltransferase [Virgibacillus sp. LDC-1]